MPSDVTPPTLVSLSITDVVYLGNDAPWITVSARGTDDLSGISQMNVWFDRNLTYSFSLPPASTNFISAPLIGIYNYDGGWSDGSISRSVVVSTFGEAGIRTVTRITIQDQVGNVRTYDADDLAAFGFGGTVELVNARHTAGTPGDDQLSGGGAADYADFLDGLAGNDTIRGNGGHDRLDGGDGDDLMFGGAGNDVYVVDSSQDIVEELLGQGTDLVYSSVDITLSENVERLALAGTRGLNGTGNQLDNQISGGAGSDLLEGGDGDDALAGGRGDDSLVGGAGNDTLTGDLGTDRLMGGTGNDTYVVAGAADMVREAANSGTDVVESSVSWTLAALGAVENLTLTGLAAIAGTGNGLANRIVGNSGRNLVSGAAGNDTLLGGAGDDTLVGGAGADRLEGGSGNDRYEIDVTDVIVETATGGVDTVVSSSDLTLGTNLENGVLTGSALRAAGNDGANHLTGNTGDNLLDGGAGNDTLVGGDGNDSLGGGAGSNQLVGGAGNDVYRIASASDRAIEAAGAGTDRVEASTSHVLAANIETLVLIGAAAIDGAGNSLANRLIGNAAANVLSGGAGDDTIQGGAGNDTLVGGAGVDRLEGGVGHDVYRVSSPTSRISEAAGAGIDRVEASISHALVGNVEALILTGNAGINGTGNGHANRLIGNAGDNILSGGAGNDVLDGRDGDDVLEGGAGADVLTGGAWWDVFRFRTTDDSRTTAPDRITDFGLGDTIDLSLIDANSKVAGNQAFTFFDDVKATPQAGALYYTQKDGMIWGDVNGDTLADFKIKITAGYDLVWLNLQL